ncbi:ATP-binding cassette domain-containing protein [Ensifer canadensis]
MSTEQQQARPVLEIDGLSISYGGKPAVSNVNLTIQPGEIVGIIGESGSGKSTLAHSILGLLPSSAAVSGKALSLAGTNLLGADGSAFRVRSRTGCRHGFPEPDDYLQPVASAG